MLILGLDPGTATTGYGIIEKCGATVKPVEYGIISTPAGGNMADRLNTIHTKLVALLAAFRPAAVAVEEIFYHRNAKTVISVAQSRGVILLAAAQNGIQVAEYTPLQVKQSVVGYGQADKRQVQLMVKQILNLSSVPKPDDAADALAIAICHLHSYKWQQY